MSMTPWRCGLLVAWSLGPLTGCQYILGLTESAPADAGAINDAVEPDDALVAMDGAPVGDGALPVDAAVPPPITVGYWRMERDDDADGNRLSTPNEIPGGQPLMANDCVLDGQVPVSPIPATGAVNDSSLEALFTMDSTIAYDDVFDLDSLTVEFWARTSENSAVLFGRTADINTDGLVIEEPDAVRVRYVVSDGVGGSSAVDMATGVDMDEQWRHYAFTYDQATGVGCFYVDGAEATCHDGPDGFAIEWAAGVPIRVGQGLGGGAVNGGILDELRISDGALPPSRFLRAL